ncbi:MAG TPA: exodeoxyribonuclease VII large subunit [Pyrinomonadaceae bacterium]|nr:exodeoxyribonuclease VII large subunit [Pyrinomonadaceae bacterium]
MSQPLFAALFDETENRPVTVSELTNSVRITLEGRFASVWIEGEISNFTAHSSGHWFFTLKDEGAQIRAKCFRSSNTRIRFRPQNGLHVRARGRLSVYPPRGEYEIVVETLDPVGAGALRIAFEQLRDRLRAEGLFAEALKRPLPVFPHRVGIVTSPTGAALRDILNVISRRTRTVHVLFVPAKVQGESAGSDVARAIRFVNQHHQRAIAEGREGDGVDVLIVGRGGGSTEDLWAFNQEEVARAIRASAIPVISAVGHETDFTIADFAADLRAPTPSAAAELVATHEDELCTRLGQLEKQLQRLVRYRIVNARSRVQKNALSQAFDEVRGKLQSARRDTEQANHELELLIKRFFQAAQRRAGEVINRLSPAELRERVSHSRARFEAASAGCSAATMGNVEEARKQLGLAAAALDALSPLAVLERGYAIAQDKNGRLVREASSVSIGDPLKVRLAKGKLDCLVNGVEEN